MKGMKKSSGEGGPLGSAGIMSNFKISGGGPKIKPEIVIVGSIAVILIIALMSWL